jgi:hypothetical protein
LNVQKQRYAEIVEVNNVQRGPSEAHVSSQVSLVIYLFQLIDLNFISLLTFWHRSFTFNSNKSPNWCNSFSVYYPDVCLQLNMFWTLFHPSSKAQWLQWQPLLLPSYRGDSRAVFVVGPAGPTMKTARLSSRYEGKSRGCHCSHWAPDDGRKTPEICWAVNKRQDNKLKICCIRLMIYFNCTIMYRLTNLKFYI